MTRRTCNRILLSLLLTLSMGSALGDVPGARPRDLVVRSDGTVLLTSMDSNSVTQLTWNGASFADPIYIDVGGKSWGVELLDDDTAVVTLPYEDHLVVLDWNGTQFGPAFETWPAEYFCTDVITSNVPGRVFVANRGAAPGGGEAWQHAVYEIDDMGIQRTFVTDREPRVLVLSPDERRLFVGHVQGSLGGPSHAVGGGPIDESHGLSSPDYDGGSIIAFDIENGSETPIHRFLIGSPVRGLAVLPLGGDYRVFFTHVGFGAAAEDPDFGGKDIANFISSIKFNVSHVPQERDDYVLGHDSGAEASGSDRPAILHERLVVRQSGGVNELWVTNSGSGSVSRIRLDASGEASTTLILDAITFPQVLPDPDRAPEGWLLDASIDPAVPQDLLEVVCDSVAHFGVGTIFSNPRPLVVDEGRNRILVATQQEHELGSIAISDPTSCGSVTVTDVEDLLDGATNPVTPDEKEFFTFGSAFRFRENRPPLPERLLLFDGALTKPLAPPQVAMEDMTNTITCGTCHVDGHLDGKLRFIVRDNRIAGRAGFQPGENGATIGKVVANGVKKRAKPVQVPTLFDVGDTEWLFFEGTKSIRDGKPSGDPDQRCEYCFDNGFFHNTAAFTSAVASPISPHAADGVLNESQTRGRFLFEAMNCSRCHGGAMREEFPRSRMDDDAHPFVGQFGPLPGGGAADPPHNPTESGGLIVANRFLHDATQVFLDADSPPGTPLATRNVTDVGTKFMGPPSVPHSIIEGVNTPALAGLWDNRPYMHDGRYRTIQAVLEHTYLKTSGAEDHRAAELVFEGTPNNSQGGVVVTDPDDLVSIAVDPEFEFRTHQEIAPAGRKSVWEYLTVDLSGTRARNDLLAFLGAVSSQTELCGATADDLFDGYTATAGTCDIALAYDTMTPVETRVEVQYLGGGGTKQIVEITPRGTSHVSSVPVAAPGFYEITVTAHMRTVCLDPVQFTDTVEITDTCTILADSSPIYVCPQGDATALVIDVSLDSAVYGTEDIAADRFAIGSVVGGSVGVFVETGEADGPATLVGSNLETTITLPHVGGCAVESDLAAIPVLLDGVPIGATSSEIRSTDMSGDGIIDLIDISMFAPAWGKCAGEPGYTECANFAFGDNCVSLGDLSLLAIHNYHKTPDPPARLAPLAVSSAVVRLARDVTRAQTDLGDTRLRVLGEGLQGTASVVLLLEVTGDVDELRWRPATGFGRSELLPLEAGVSEWVLFIDGLDRDASLYAVLGELIALGGADVVIAGGVFETSDGATERLGVDGDAPPATAAVPVRDFLAVNHPNPFHPSTSIRYAVSVDAHVSLAVFNVKGQLVRTLVDDQRTVGEHEVVWDGRDMQGHRISPGVYFYRLKTPTFTRTRKMVVPR